MVDLGMDASSYDYLEPLLRAHQEGRWGRLGRSSLQVYHYMALEELARERGLACRRVKLRLDCRSNRGRPDKAVIPGLVLFQGRREVLCDLHGNQTPWQVVRAFAEQYKLQIPLNSDMKNLDTWETWTGARPGMQVGRKLAGQAQLDELVNSGRAMLQAFHLQQSCIDGSGTPPRPVLRI